MDVVIYLALFVGGVCLGGQLNRGIYRLAWFQRSIGPWSAPHADAPPRRAVDRLPVVGWCFLARESSIHGPMYWFRPMVIELSVGIGAVVLYWWEIKEAALMPSLVPPGVSTILLHTQYFTHVFLFSLMIVATFIDFDEKTIPDAITVPGTLIGLVLMALLPIAAPPIAVLAAPGRFEVGSLLFTSPNAWPDWLNGPYGLLMGLICYVAWCLAIWPKTTTLRRGLIKGVQFMLASMFRYAGWLWIVAICVLGCLGFAWVWWWMPANWPSLLTALVGMAGGGGLIWAVRIVGGGALGKEAMGFGDVTLMAMIGVYVGWQASILIFFLAPIVAVFICLAQWLLTGRRDIAFGPYLCVAAAIMILGWNHVWEQHARAVFSMGLLVPQAMFCCLIMLGGTLALWRIVEQALFGRR